MARFPAYDADALNALDAQGAAIARVFEAAGHVRVEPPVVQPAAAFLDRSGEDIRRRMFLFAAPDGGELCLRPDLTIPACRMALAGGLAPGQSARVHYRGPAFRYQPAEPHRPAQFEQAGIERIGGAAADGADAGTVTLIAQAVRETGLQRIALKLGDLALFAALVDALDMPAAWRGRLKRHFWRPAYFEELLGRLTGAQDESGGRAALLRALGGLDGAEARAAVADLIAVAGVTPVGGRTLDEIAERLLEQAAEAAAARLPEASARLIRAFLDISGPARAALETIRSLTQAAGVALDAPLDAMASRLDAIEAAAPGLEAATFHAHFGRNMEYYSGFVFELWSADSEGPVQIAGGGRYDGLLSALGAPGAMPAVGGAIRTERVLAARRAVGGA